MYYTYLIDAYLACIHQLAVIKVSHGAETFAEQELVNNSLNKKVNAPSSRQMQSVIHRQTAKATSLEKAQRMSKTSRPNNSKVIQGEAEH